MYVRWIIWIMSERDVRARKDSNNLRVRILCAQLPNLIVTAGGCWPILCVPFTKTTPHFPFTRPVYLQKYILHAVTWHPALGSARTLALVLATAAANRDGKLPLSCEYIYIYIARADFWWIFLFHRAACNATHLYAKDEEMFVWPFQSLADWAWAESDTD
jgi:hypothetical protein